MSEKAKAAVEQREETAEASEVAEVEGHREISAAELMGIAEALIFVAEEPISVRTIAEVLEVDKDAVNVALEVLVD
jgi:hypothetical protein